MSILLLSTATYSIKLSIENSNSPFQSPENRSARKDPHTLLAGSFSTRLLTVPKQYDSDYRTAVLRMILYAPILLAALALAAATALPPMVPSDSPAQCGLACGTDEQCTSPGCHVCQYLGAGKSQCVQSSLPSIHHLGKPQQAGTLVGPDTG